MEISNNSETLPLSTKHEILDSNPESQVQSQEYRNRKDDPNESSARYLNLPKNLIDDISQNNLNPIGIQKDMLVSSSAVADHIYKWTTNPEEAKALSLEDLSGMSQSELIAQVLSDQKKISELKNPNLGSGTSESYQKLSSELSLKIDSDCTGTANPLNNSTHDIKILRSKLTGNNLQIIPENSEVPPVALKSSVEIETPSDLHLIQSPLITTPPYEYILVSKENEAKLRLYLNPRLDKSFGQEIDKLKNSQSAPTPTSNRSNNNNANETERQYTPSPSDRVFGPGVTIHCFDPSDIDLEMKKIIIENPPLTHGIVRRKPRKERGSSVPAIDSYYGTKDLAMVGHASYFIPMLTSIERKAIGWKDQYRYGKWKYSPPNIPLLTSGHTPLRHNLSTKGKSIHHQSGSEVTNSSEYIGWRPSMTSQRILTMSHLPCLTEATQEHVKAIDEDATELNFIAMSDSKGSKSCQIIRDKGNIKRFLRWLVPCIKSKKGNCKDNGSESSGDSEDENEAIGTIGQASEGAEVNNGSSHRPDPPRHHNHQSHGHGCFPYYRHSHKVQVTGGDVPVSTDDSIVSVPNKLGPLSSLDHKTPDDKHGDKLNVKMFSEDVIQTDYEVSNLSEPFCVQELGEGKTAISETIIKGQEIATMEVVQQTEINTLIVSEINRNLEDQDEIHSGKIDEPQTTGVKSATQIPSTSLGIQATELPSEITTDPEPWSTKCQEDDGADYDDNCSNYSEFLATPDTIISISTEDAKGISDGSYEDDPMYGDDSSTLADTDFSDEIEEQVFEYDPGLDYASMPESRFLDPKDLELSPRYANFKLLSNGMMASDYYDDEDDDPNMSDGQYNYYPSEDEDEDESGNYPNQNEMDGLWSEKSTISSGISECTKATKGNKGQAGINNNVNESSTL